MHRRAICATLAILMGGCTVGPDFHAPDPPAVAAFTKDPLPDETETASVAGGQAQRFVQGRDIPGEWWELFHSQPLNALIEQSLKTSPSLQAAQAALRVAMENIRAQQGLAFPLLTVGFGASRNQNADQVSPALASSVRLYNLYQGQLNASWTLDVFGANRRQVEALQALADGQRYQLEATYLALTANVVAAAVQEASLRAQIAAAEEVITDESDALMIMRRQNASGQIAGADVAAQEAALAQVQQVVPLLRKQLAQQRDLLTALAGRFPAEEIEETFELSALELPEELPVSLPSRLIEQRPDIRIAEENLHAASAQIGVAVANRLPNLTLSANEGTVATTLGELFQPGNAFWSVGANLAQPLFDGGTLLHRTRAAEAAYDQTASAYRVTVIGAFQNVADALHALQSDAEALKAAAASEAAAARSLNIVRRQLELGQIAYLGLLTAQQTYQQALINRLQVQASRYVDTATLFQALGGGWWNRSDVLIGEQSR
ncbi:MAG TPA: efflux transporter outer membrane subunit [Micropepsaceae bacterium]|nr:efflux transporter outer membrane subunit [Micropepsaceae bacterium]